MQAFDNSHQVAHSPELSIPPMETTFIDSIHLGEGAGKFLPPLHCTPPPNKSQSTTVTCNTVLNNTLLLPNKLQI